MGIGWLDRDPAFELKSCLNEYIRYVGRSNTAANLNKVFILTCCISLSQFELECKLVSYVLNSRVKINKFY